MIFVQALMINTRLHKLNSETNIALFFFHRKGVNNTVKFGFSSISSLALSFVNGIMGRKKGYYSASPATYAEALGKIAC